MNKPPTSKTKTTTTTPPALNYKLKDNLFIASNRTTDAKPPPPVAKIDKSTVTRTIDSNNEQKKHVRASVQKMATSSNVSSSPWKTKTTANKKTTTTTTTKQLPPSPPSSKRLSSRSSLTPSPKTTTSSTTSISSGATKKIPRRLSATTRQQNAPAAPAAAPAHTAKPESTSNTTATNDDVEHSDPKQMQPPKAVERPTSSSTTTDTSSTRSTSRFSVSGSSTSSNDDGVHEDDGVVAGATAGATTVKDGDLPWGTHTLPEAAIKASTGQQKEEDTLSNKFDPVQMSYQLAAAHAQLTAAKFSIAPSMQVAEQWQQKYKGLIASADQLRDRILVETDIQRSIASVLKLSTTPDSRMLNELYAHTGNVDSLCHELSLTLAHAYDSRTRYLEHLAGTLARAPPSLSDLDDSRPYTEREQALMQEIVELRSREAAMTNEEEARRRHEKELVADHVDKLQKELARWQHQVHQSRQREVDQHHHIESLTSKFQLREAELELELETLRQAHDAHAGLMAANARLEQALEETRLREAKLRADHLEEMEQVKEEYRVREAELQEREIRPLQEALAQARQRETDLVTQLRNKSEPRLAAAVVTSVVTEEALDTDERQRQREADLIGKIEEHVSHIHTLEAQVEAMQAQITRDEHAKKAILEKDSTLPVEEEEAELVVETQCVPEAQQTADELKKALETTRCESLSDMVAKLQLFASAQDEFTRREAAMMLQQASVEAELGSLLKEYDRLTRSINDSHLDRKHYESQIQALTRAKQELDKEVADYRVKDGIGIDGETMTLRKEFRQLMATVKAEHEQAMEKEAERRRMVENELRDIKHALEMKRWDRVSTGVQTHFVPYPGVV